MVSSEGFEYAVRDYYDMLNKKYPQKAILKLVGDRYKLSRTERSMLYRGVSAKEGNKFRSEKLIPEELVKDHDLFVDGLNQILTVAAYLNGNVVFISSDGFLRDASEIHGKIFRSALLSRTVKLICEYCRTLHLKQLIFYVDEQVNGAERIKNLLLKKTHELKINFKIVMSYRVDKELKSLTNGIIATSDSQVIQKSISNIFDLALQTLKFHFNPEIIDLNTLLLP